VIGKEVVVRWLALGLLFAGCYGDVLVTDPDGSVSFQTLIQTQTSGITVSRRQLIETSSE
jgi:hypothetical protein